MLYPKLYKKDTKGKTRFWRIETDDQGAYRTISGELLGKAVTSEWTVCTPKNVGRSNQTTAIFQCESEVASLYQKKRDKHYVDTVSAVEDERKYFEVMLAHKYAEGKIIKPEFIRNQKYVADALARGRRVFMQPKLDGLRGPTQREGTFSRGGKEFTTVRFLAREVLGSLFADAPSLVLDGELYNHEYHDDFNEIVSTIKNGGGAEYVARARELVQFHIYDIYIPEAPQMLFSQRHEFLQGLLSAYNPDPKKIVLVETIEVTHVDQLRQIYECYLEEEYEGGMVRVDAHYQHKRTNDVQKWKEMEDAEFPIDHIEEGKGNWAGCAKRIFLRMPNGSISKAGMMGSQGYLAQVLRDADKYRGGTATVRFQGFTPDGKLRFGRSLPGKLYMGPRDD